MSAHSDADFYPEASGAARRLLSQRRAEQPIKLYAGWFFQRVWLALEEKQIPYEYIEVNPYNKPDHLLAANPRGLVPTLLCPSQNGTKALYESTVLLEYLEDAYPDNRPKLLPSDPYERARARIWIHYVTTKIIPSFHRFLQYQPTGHANDADINAGLNKARREFLECLKTWTKEMHSEGPFFLGSDIGMPDLVMAPWAIRLWVFDEFKCGLRIPTEGNGGSDEDVWNRWRNWMAAIEARKSVEQTTSERAHYYPIYKRYADNTAQSELAKATRSGRGVP
ncbi:hypothetical protein N7488_004667 [Penicillium malachiteum]|nr:hypothetical protein N7488_004667 [Penicillium malachiteum]